MVNFTPYFYPLLSFSYRFMILIWERNLEEKRIMSHSGKTFLNQVDLGLSRSSNNLVNIIFFYYAICKMDVTPPGRCRGKDSPD